VSLIELTELASPTGSPSGAGDSASAPAAGAWRRVRSGAGVPSGVQALLVDDYIYIGILGIYGIQPYYEYKFIYN
jgi:hypothetical protein